MSYITQFQHLQQFTSVEEMDLHVKQIRQTFAGQLTKTAWDVLDWIKQHALKVKGVSYLKVDTIAKGVGKSARTIQYATKLLCSFKILEKVETTRPRQKGDGANVYVIKADCMADCTPLSAPRHVNGTPTETRVEEEKRETESLNSFNRSTKLLNKRIERDDHPTIAVDNFFEKPLYADIPAILQTTLGRFGGAEGNRLWKKIIQAYTHSKLYSYFEKAKLQDLAAIYTGFAGKLFGKVHHTLNDCLIGVIDDKFGYLYTVTHNFFNDTIEEIEERRRREAIEAFRKRMGLDEPDWLYSN